jgi:anti-sigma factor RsiW
MLQNLEDYLAGSLEPVGLREMEAHLSTCSTCREEVRGMREVSAMFGTLRPGSMTWDIAPGFALKVMEDVGRKPVPAFASFFALNAAFGRRLVFASLLTLAIVGGYLVSHESQYPAGPSPEAILAQPNGPAFQSARAEDNMLVTLTAYEH